MTEIASVVIRQSVVLLVALGASVLLRRQPAAVRHFVLTVAIACAVLMPALETLSPRWHVGPSAGRGAVTTETAGAFQVEERPGIAMSRATPSASAGMLTSYPGILTLALATWASGSLLALAVLGIAIVRLARVTREAQLVDDGPARECADEIARTMGLARSVAILRSSRSGVAFTWGLVPPRVLLPAAAVEWNVERLRAVLQHELAHVARRDWAIQVSAAVGQAVWWFNPLLWVACRQLRRESELAADDVVLQAGVDGADYASHLVDIARHATVGNGHWLPAPSIVHQSTLEGRIRAMLKTDVDRRPLSHRTKALTFALALAIVLPIAGAASSVEQEPAAAQAPTGPASVSGVIYDQAGGLLPGVSVILTHVQTTGRYEATSDPKGGFGFRSLPPGDYELTTSLAGFNPVKNLLLLGPGAAVRRYVTMPLGTIQETISVTPDPPGTKPPAPVRIAREIPEPKVPGPCTGAIGGCIKVPRKMVHVSPLYPGDLAATGRGGTVVITGRIGIDGYMADMRLRDDAGEHASLQAAALEAVRQWEFDPTRLNGAPVETNITVNVYFNAK